MVVFCFGFVADFGGSIVLVVVLAIFIWVCGRFDGFEVVFCFGFLMVIYGCCGCFSC